MASMGVVATGVLVFVLSQAILKLVLEPLQNFNKEGGDTSFLLMYFKISSVDRAKKIKIEDYDLGVMGASLVACIAKISFYNALASVKLLKLPSESDVRSAAALIAKVSDMIRAEKLRENANSIDQKLDQIAKLLKIDAAIPN